MTTDTPVPVDIGTIVTSVLVRKIIYGVYAVAAVIVGGIAAYFLGIHTPEPNAVVGAQAVISYLAIPVGGLAFANAQTTQKAIKALQAVAPVAPVAISEPAPTA